jgi:RHS repeat-associated protein
MQEALPSTARSARTARYRRNRWYGPQTGRFLTQDPSGLAGGVNLYAYAGNDPISYTDPFGLSSSTCCTLSLVDPGVVMRETPDFDVEKLSKDAEEGLRMFVSLAAGPGEVKVAKGLFGKLLGKTRAGTGSKVGKLVGSGYPTKLNSAGRLQPYDPATGRYLSPAANPGVAQSPLGHFSVGFTQGYASATTGAIAPDAVTNAQQIGQAIDQILGAIVGAF